MKLLQAFLFSLCTVLLLGAAEPTAPEQIADGWETAAPASLGLDPAPLDGADGVVHVLRCLLAEADLLMAVDGYPAVADLGPETLRRGNSEGL